MNVQSCIARSADGVPIHYDVHGKGPTALVFVHGWCCERRYWDLQTRHFGYHTVVTLDLAGHGESGRGRARWTMSSFGQDVVAIVEQLGLEQVVLVGHSMGGAVIVEAARYSPSTIIGLVGVDTWHNVEHTWTPAQVDAIVAPFRADFVQAMRAFVQTLFLPTSDAMLVEEIAMTMSAIPPQIGVAVGEQVLAYDGVLQKRLQEICARKIAINSIDLQAPNVEAAQRCGVEFVLMSGVGHFSMREDPHTFNQLLDRAVKEIILSRTPQ